MNHCCRHDGCHELSEGACPRAHAVLNTEDDGSGSSKHLEEAPAARERCSTLATAPEKPDTLVSVQLDRWRSSDAPPRPSPAIENCRTESLPRAVNEALQWQVCDPASSMQPMHGKAEADIHQTFQGMDRAHWGASQAAPGGGTCLRQTVRQSVPPGRQGAEQPGPAGPGRRMSAAPWG